MYNTNNFLIIAVLLTIWVIINFHLPPIWYNSYASRNPYYLQLVLFIFVHVSTWNIFILKHIFHHFSNYIPKLILFFIVLIKVCKWYFFFFILIFVYGKAVRLHLFLYTNIFPHCFHDAYKHMWCNLLMFLSYHWNGEGIFKGKPKTPRIFKRAHSLGKKMCEILID